jgi:hypothetical protein
MIEPMAKEVCEKCMSELEDADAKELAIHRRVRQDELFEKMRRGFGCEGLSETRITLGYRHGDRICGD